MSRLFKYVSSLQKFIKDRSFNNINIKTKEKIYLLDKTEEQDLDDAISNILFTNTQENNLLMSVMLLTIMNGQNKKNKVSIQGYYAATTIELLYNIILIGELDDIKLSKELKTKLTNYITICSNNFLCNNLETIKENPKMSDKVSTIMITSLKMFNNTVDYKLLLNKHVYILEEKKKDNKLLTWYIKDLIIKEEKEEDKSKESKEDKSKEKSKSKIKIILEEKFKNIVPIQKDNFLDYLNKKISTVSELSFCLGWVLGGGDEKKLPRVKKAGRSFGLVYKLYNDFSNIEKDLINSNSNLSNNYIINYGLQSSYEFYMENKQKFITEVMLLEIYTDTVKEIINYIDGKIDEIINETSPDLKSSSGSSNANVNVKNKIKLALD
jgi:hypothetical protein